MGGSRYAAACAAVGWVLMGFFVIGRAAEPFPPSHYSMLRQAAEEAVKTALSGGESGGRDIGEVLSERVGSDIFLQWEEDGWSEKVVVPVLLEKLLEVRGLTVKRGTLSPKGSFVITAQVDTAGVIVEGTRVLIGSDKQPVTRNAFVNLRLRVEKSGVGLWYGSGRGEARDRFSMKFLKILDEDGVLPVEMSITRSLPAALFGPIVYITSTTAILYYYFTSRKL